MIRKILCKFIELGCLKVEKLLYKIENFLHKRATDPIEWNDETIAKRLEWVGSYASEQAYLERFLKEGHITQAQYNKFCPTLEQIICDLEEDLKYEKEEVDNISKRLEEAKKQQLIEKLSGINDKQIKN